MRVLILVVLFAGIAIFSAQPSLSCQACYQEPGQPSGICINQIPGFVICLPGGPNGCTVSTPCDVAGCFLPGSLVETKDGPRPIESIGIGELILSSQENGCALDNEKVVKTYRSIQYGYYLINGTIKVTRLHPFRVKDKWITAENLKVGDELTSRDGGHVLVESIEKIDRAVRAYNIEVAGDHTFFVHGVLVHNKGPDPKI